MACSRTLSIALFTRWLIMITLPAIVVSIQLRETDDETFSDTTMVPHPQSRLALPVDSPGVMQQSVLVDDSMDCTLACLEQHWCHSINLKTRPTNKGKHVCELMSSDKYNYTKYFVSDKEFTHFSIKNPCDKSPCSKHGKCVALYGKQDYYCACSVGYTGRHCKSDINECAGPNGCHADATCRNTPGSYQCTCKTGYHGDGRNCQDINECAGRNGCHAYATCRNTIGSYQCTCKTGYRGDGRNCQDINECAGANGCHAYATCRNTPGSYQCTCKTGYHGNGRNCQDINECAGANGCHAYATCSNTPGSYQCTCKTGYHGDGRNCQGHTRNVGLSHGSSGRLDVYYNGQWGTVCDDYFDTNLNGGHVICRMLGYTRATQVGNAVKMGYGQGTGKIWLDDVKCTGSESSIFNCPHLSMGVHNCQHSEDAGVVCG